MTMFKKEIFTVSAPAPIGVYSQAIASKGGQMVFLAGQIGLEPQSGTLEDSFEKQAQQALANINAVAQESGGSLANIVKITIFLIDMDNYSYINSLMERLFNKPYPARSTIQVAALPKGALVEIEAVLVLE